MKRKKFLTLVVSIIVCVFACALIGCGETPDGGPSGAPSGNPEEPSHVCVFDQKVAKETYLNSNGTCTQKATYYFSCTCGEKGTETFEHDILKEHSLNQDGDCTVCNQSILVDYIVEDNLKYLGNTQNPYYALVEMTDKNLSSCEINEDTRIILERAFYYCRSLENVTIGNKVTSIGDYAFFSCSITNIVIPNSVMSIGDNAFYNCISLRSIVIPDSVTSIGEYAFATCPWLESVTIGNNVTSIGKDAFYGCINLEYNVEGNLKYLGNTQNPYYALIGVVDKNSLNYAINQNTRIISGNAFSDCILLESIVVPESVTSIGEYAFDGCDSLKNIIISNSVTSIGDYAFCDCRSLESIVIPESVTSIGDYAFYNWTPAQTIKCIATSKPSGWSGRWNRFCSAQIVLGYTGD